MLSVNPIPFSIVPPLGLLIVNVSETLWFSATVAAPKDLVMLGGATTVRFAVLLVPPVPSSVEVTAVVVLLFAPAVVPVTFTENVHPVLAASVAPDKFTEPDPCAAVIVPPPHEPVRPLGVATIRPACSMSVNPIPLSEVLPFGLLMVKLSDVDPLNGIVAAPKEFRIVGGPNTLTLAEAVRTPPPSVS